MATENNVLVVVDWACRVVRVFEDTEEARLAVHGWQLHDQAHLSGQIAPADVKDIVTFVTGRGVKQFKTHTIHLFD